MNKISNNVNINSNLSFKAELNSKMIEGIKLFDGLNVKEIDFIRTNLETVNLFRGCHVGCSHCLKNANKPINGNKTILFEDLVEFTNGFKTLNERAGENVLTNTEYLNIVDDSNPSDIQINGLNRKHSVVEAMRLIFEKLNLPTLFVTSGWNPKSKYAQEASEEIAKMVIKNPNSVKNIEISLNPFAHIMEQARNALKNGDNEKYNVLKSIYTSRMANTLATFADLFPLHKAQIIYRHAKDGNQGVDYNAMKSLYEEIYTKLKAIIGMKAEIIPELQIDNVTHFEKSHLIEPSGRARQFFEENYNMKEQAELISESMNWDSLSQDEKMNKLKDTALKCVDINGNIYATFPATEVSHENTPIELTVKTPMRLNYQNTTPTNPVFSDIELDI